MIMPIFGHEKNQRTVQQIQGIRKSRPRNVWGNGSSDYLLLYLLHADFLGRKQFPYILLDFLTQLVSWQVIGVVTKWIFNFFSNKLYAH